MRLYPRLRSTAWPAIGAGLALGTAMVSAHQSPAPATDAPQARIACRVARELEGGDVKGASIDAEREQPLAQLDLRLDELPGAEAVERATHVAGRNRVAGGRERPRTTSRQRGGTLPVYDSCMRIA